MKTLSDKFHLLIFFLIGTSFAIAGNPANPPPPDPTGRRRPPPPPGLDIDQHIFILFSVAILFGIYIIYRNNLKRKNPI
jgi:hypothetical protein